MRRLRLGNIEPSTTAPSVDAADEELLARYVEAFERYDMDALTSLIHEDATQSMPPYDLWLAGRDDILTLVVRPGDHAARTRASSRWPRRTERRRSGSTGRARTARATSRGRSRCVEIEDGKIVELTFFLDTQTVFPLFGLPLEYEPA